MSNPDIYQLVPDDTIREEYGKFDFTRLPEMKKGIGRISGGAKELHGKS